jgi:glycine cleavage system aminomethyltransferase T
VYCACCRYTGEDGFELSIPNDHMVKLAEALVANPEVSVSFVRQRWEAKVAV